MVYVWLHSTCLLGQVECSAELDAYVWAQLMVEHYAEVSSALIQMNSFIWTPLTLKWHTGVWVIEVLLYCTPAGENIGKLMANCQRFSLKFMEYPCVSFVDHSPKFSPPNNLNKGICQCFLLYSTITFL